MTRIDKALRGIGVAVMYGALGIALGGLVYFLFKMTAHAYAVEGAFYFAGALVIDGIVLFAVGGVMLYVAENGGVA